MEQIFRIFLLLLTAYIAAQFMSNVIADLWEAYKSAQASYLPKRLGNY